MKERERLLYNLRVISGRLRDARDSVDSCEKDIAEILKRLDAIERGEVPTPAEPR